MPKNDEGKVIIFASKFGKPFTPQNVYIKEEFSGAVTQGTN